MAASGKGPRAARTFASTFATVTGCRVELYATDGAQGAARGAGVGAGVYAGPGEAFGGLTAVKTVEPDPAQAAEYAEACGRWTELLERDLDVSPSGSSRSGASPAP